MTQVFPQNNFSYDSQVLGSGRLADKTPVKKKYASIEAPCSKVVDFASGQVLKAGTFFHFNSSGLAVAGLNIAESALVTFTTALTAGQTLIMAGLTFTAGASGTTVAQLVEAWSNLGDGIASGTGYADLTAVTDSTAGGTFTAGTLTGYAVEKVDANTVVFNAIPALANATNVAATGTGAAPTITISAGSASWTPPAGVTAYDVDTTDGIASAAVFMEAELWGVDDGTCWLRWKTDPQETIPLLDGTTRACTAYNTGASGITAESNRLKQLYVNGSEIEVYFYNEGDKNYMSGAL